MRVWKPKDNIPMKYNSPRYLLRRYELLKLVKPSSNFLEIGPGNLLLAAELLNYFQSGTLVEYNPDVQTIFNQLNSNLKKRLELLVCDFQKMETTNKFSCVVACEVLEHIKDEARFLEKAREMLQHKGQLILSVPARKKYFSFDDEIVGHYRRYEKQEIARILSESNFESVKIISYGFPFVNIFRIGRIMLSKIGSKTKYRWSQEKKSKESSLLRINPFFTLLNLLINKYTFFPLNIIASLFNGLDLSEGYLISAVKP